MPLSFELLYFGGNDCLCLFVPFLIVYCIVDDAIQGRPDE
jgi:hypothetical protein